VVRVVVQADETLFRSAWFLESVATELAVMLVLRTRRPFFRSRPRATLLGSSVAVGLVTLVIPFSPSAPVFGFEAVPVSVLLALVVITAGYVLATEVAKRLFYGARRIAPRAVNAGTASARAPS
jgi:P-type Mg2+ transporter